jgi:Cu/Ag efflux protein CusF
LLRESALHCFGRRLRLLIVLSLLLGAACRQQPATQTAPPATPPPSPTITPRPAPILNHPYPGRGVVKIINRKEGWIEIDHEDIQGLMPAMEMEFWVKDRSLMDNVSVGDHVDFTIVETEKGEYLTQIKKVRAVSDPR